MVGVDTSLFLEQRAIEGVSISAYKQSSNVNVSATLTYSVVARSSLGAGCDGRTQEAGAERTFNLPDQQVADLVAELV